ncbi:helix-turn-helix domain-containing protein [Jiella marina]|uniref:helix-turn-helix domain-containing protein n=1 Tax=Jiella sp. LLJ827 TaxID=2917712 RepID=UPI002100F9F8|nr:helix-turn-helix transcriptional regulator [Jiella sp. LLJ827]MCQ0987225.1 helix-turn-helix transcriptional regulator [Jiella sp. LLJ827]
MAQRELLAENLSLLCRGKNVAAICRSIGINRAQFNRYLSGQALPSERNVTKIAAYFGVQPTALFQDDAIGSSYQPDRQRLGILHEAMSLIGDERPSSLEPGLYFVTFGYPPDPKTVVRSVMIVEIKGNLTVFRRLTGFGERERTWWSLYGGNHIGIVLDRRRYLYFMSMSTFGNREPSLLAMEWTSTQVPVLVGHGTVLGTSDSLLVPAVITRCRPRMKLRTALRQCRAYNIDDADIESFVVDTLTEKGNELAHMLKPLDISIKIRPSS